MADVSEPHERRMNNAARSQRDQGLLNWRDVGVLYGREMRAALREKAMARVRERYSWDAVTDAYEALTRSLVE